MDVVPRPTWKQDNSNHIRQKLSSSGIVINICVSEKYIVLSLDDRTIHVFTAGGTHVTVFRNQVQNAWSLALQNNILLTGEIDGGIRCWDLTECVLKSSLIGHTKTVRCLRFARAKTAISACRDGLLKIWDLETGTCQVTLSGHRGPIVSLAVTEAVAISGSFDGTAKVWSLAEQRNMWTLSSHAGAVYRVDFDRERIFTGSLDQDVRVWDLTNGELLAILKGHQSLVSHIRVHGDVLVTGGADGKIIIWSLQDFTILHAIPQAHEGAVTSLDARDGHVLSGGSDGAVKLWDLKTGKLLGDLGTHTQAVWSVSLGRGDSMVAIVASAQGTSVFPKHDGAFLDIWSLG